MADTQTVQSPRDLRPLSPSLEASKGIKNLYGFVGGSRTPEQFRVEAIQHCEVKRLRFLSQKSPKRMESSSVSTRSAKKMYPTIDTDKPTSSYGSFRARRYQHTGMNQTGPSFFSTKSPESEPMRYVDLINPQTDRTYDRPLGNNNNNPTKEEKGTTAFSDDSDDGAIAIEHTDEREGLNSPDSRRGTSAQTARGFSRFKLALMQSMMTPQNSEPQLRKKKKSESETLEQLQERLAKTFAISSEESLQPVVEEKKDSFTDVKTMKQCFTEINTINYGILQEIDKLDLKENNDKKKFREVYQQLQVKLKKRLLEKADRRDKFNKDIFINILKTIIKKEVPIESEEIKFIRENLHCTIDRVREEVEMYRKLQDDVRKASTQAKEDIKVLKNQREALVKRSLSNRRLNSIRKIDLAIVSNEHKITLCEETLAKHENAEEEALAKLGELLKIPKDEDPFHMTNLSPVLGVLNHDELEGKKPQINRKPTLGTFLGRGPKRSNTRKGTISDKQMVFSHFLRGHKTKPHEFFSSVNDNESEHLLPKGLTERQDVNPKFQMENLFEPTAGKLNTSTSYPYFKTWTPLHKKEMPFSFAR